MRRSSDRILTSHAGSLPRPDDLIDANRQREAGKVDEARVPEIAHSGGGRRRAPPGRGRHRRAGRRRVRQVDGLQGQLPRLVELFLHAAGRARRSRARPRRHAGRAARRPGNTVLSSFADRRDRLRFAAAYARSASSGISTGPRADRLAVLRRRRSATPATPPSPPTSPTSRRRSPPTASSEGFMTSIGAGELRAHRQPSLQERRRVRLRLRRRHARGIQGDRRCRPGPADRRSGDRREFRPDQSRADGRGIPQVHDAQDRGAEPCAERPAAGSHPLPSLLGQLARPAHDRHPDARHRRRHAQDRCRRLFLRGRQRAPRARMERCGRTPSCPTTS